MDSRFPSRDACMARLAIALAALATSLAIPLDVSNLTTITLTVTEPFTTTQFVTLSGSTVTAYIPSTPSPAPSGLSWHSPTKMTDLSSFNITYFPSGPQNIKLIPPSESILLPSSPSKSTLLRLFYPAHSINPAQYPIGGVEFYASPVPLSRATNVSLTYSAYFPSNFDWVLGGKMPGLYGGHRSCSGGSSAKNCFSTRLMWRARGVGELYLYAPKGQQSLTLCGNANIKQFKPNSNSITSTLSSPIISSNSSINSNSKCSLSPTYGYSLNRGSFTWLKGTWTTITQTVILNTPGIADGWFLLDVNGVRMIERKDIFYRDGQGRGSSSNFLPSPASTSTSTSVSVLTLTAISTEIVSTTTTEIRPLTLTSTTTQVQVVTYTLTTLLPTTVTISSNTLATATSVSTAMASTPMAMTSSTPTATTYASSSTTSTSVPIASYTTTISVSTSASTTGNNTASNTSNSIISTPTPSVSTTIIRTSSSAPIPTPTKATQTNADLLNGLLDPLLGTAITTRATAPSTSTSVMITSTTFNSTSISISPTSASTTSVSPSITSSSSSLNSSSGLTITSTSSKSVSTPIDLLNGLLDPLLNTNSTGGGSNKRRFIEGRRGQSLGFDDELVVPLIMDMGFINDNKGSGSVDAPASTSTPTTTFEGGDVVGVGSEPDVSGVGSSIQSGEGLGVEDLEVEVLVKAEGEFGGEFEVESDVDYDYDDDEGGGDGSVRFSGVLNSPEDDFNGDINVKGGGREDDEKDGEQEEDEKDEEGKFVEGYIEGELGDERDEDITVKDSLSGISTLTPHNHEYKYQHQHLDVHADINIGNDTTSATTSGIEEIIEIKSKMKTRTTIDVHVSVDVPIPNQNQGQTKSNSKKSRPNSNSVKVDVDVDVHLNEHEHEHEHEHTHGHSLPSSSPPSSLSSSPSSSSSSSSASSSSASLSFTSKLPSPTNSPLSSSSEVNPSLNPGPSESNDNGNSNGNGSIGSTDTDTDTAVDVENEEGNEENPIGIGIENGDDSVESGGGGEKTTEAPGFLGIFFSTFFGGHDLRYATPKDQIVWFRDFSIVVHA